MSKSYLTLIVLAAAASAHAAVFNAPNAANAPVLPSYIDFDDENCTNSGPGFGGSLTGAVTNGGAGLTLSGNATIRGFAPNFGNCPITMYWQGTGSGAFSGPTATVTPTFVLNVPAGATITCSLKVLINGIQETQFNCALPSPGGTYSLPAQTFPVPATLSTYSVQLAIVVNWTSNGLSTFSVSVPPSSSIDIMSVAAPAPTPAPSSLILGATGILVAGLAWFGIFRRRSPDTGFPF